MLCWLVIVVRRDMIENYLRPKAGQAGAGALQNSLRAWLAIVEAGSWRTPMDVKQSHPKVSVLKRGRVVFNIKGTDYRLVTQINYLAGTVEIRFLGDHAEYDRINAENI
jgi:mRNA interferase HigB